MEFPNIGKYCSRHNCNRLDFLPVKCDSCEKTFCSTHFSYEQHNCPGAYRMDIQVPVCPLCGEPVPTAPGIEPDITVGQHIDQQCKSDSKKIFTNRCNYKTCKRKELIPVTCSQCNLNFCLRHRHTADHDCKKSNRAALTSQVSQKYNICRNESRQESRNTITANGAERRRATKPANTVYHANQTPTLVGGQQSIHLQNVQGGMTEDEALAHALALSIMEADETVDRNRRNASSSSESSRNTVIVGGRENNQTNTRDRCSLS